MEVRALLDKTYAETRQLLMDNRSLLDEISEYLLVKETITGDELMAYVNAANNPLDGAPTAEDTDFAE